MPFLRPASYYAKRFHPKQFEAWKAYKAGLDLVLPWGRRTGKCLIQGSMIMTPKGPKEIETLKPGDFVYSEKAKPIQVKAVIYQGEKEVVDLCSNGTVYATSTTDHRWLSIHREGKSPPKLRNSREWYKMLAIPRIWVKAPLGHVDEPHAYALGAMLGNGCRILKGEQWEISCDNPKVPEKVARIVGAKAKRRHLANYTYTISTNVNRGGYSKFIECNHYSEWCEGKLSHEKYCDLKIIKTWNRTSLLEFIAGLIDTDGSVILSGKEILFRLSMQSKSCVEALQYALLALWQCKATIDLDDRPKYKNGPLYRIGVKNILFNKKILKELDSYLVNPARKYRKEFDLLKANNGNEAHVGVTFRNKRMAPVWDIEVDSSSHLFLTATGLVSHNTEVICEIMIEDIENYGLPCLFVAKTKDQARSIVWPKFERALKNNPNWRLYESTLEVYHLPSGAIVKIKGVDKDADNLTGSGYRIIACDEYALWKKPDVVKRVLVPMLGDYNGQIIFTSTKRGKNHFYDLHQRAIPQPRKYYVSEATMFDNTFLSDDGRAKVLSEYAGAEDPLYKQEVLNEYVTFEGMAFALPESEYITRRWDPADLDFSYHWRGMDHGYSPDPTAMVWIAYNKKFDYFLIYSEYAETKLLISQHADCVQTQEPYPIIDTYSDIDPQLVAEYEAVGLNLTNAKKSDQKARILRMVNALRIGKLKVASNCKRLLKQMAAYEWDQEGGDDLVDAAQYCFNNLTLPQQTEKKKDTLPKHVYKPSEDVHFVQSFGEDTEHRNFRYEDHDYD